MSVKFRNFVEVYLVSKKKYVFFFINKMYLNK